MSGHKLQVLSNAQESLADVIEDLREYEHLAPVKLITENLDGEIKMLQELIDKELAKGDKAGR